MTSSDKMIIDIVNVKKKYGKREILKGVSFSVAGGECIGILGGNGCGKSTLLSILAGVLRADGGRFLVRRTTGHRPGGVPNGFPNSISGGMSNSFPGGTLGSVPNGETNGFPNATPGGMSNGVPNGFPNGISDDMPNATPNAAADDALDLLRAPRRREALVGYVPQGTPLIEELTALDNLRLWYDRETLRRELPDCFRRSRRSDASAGASPARERILSRLGVGEFLRTPVRKLSGGMKKRLSIACAMAKRPPILLLDEPTAALDIPCKEEIHEYLSFYKSLGGILLLVTHDLLDLSMCDRLLLLRDGVTTPFSGPDDPALLAKAVARAVADAAVIVQERASAEAKGGTRG